MTTVKKDIYPIKQWWPVTVALVLTIFGFAAYFFPDWWFLTCYKNSHDLRCIFDPQYSSAYAGPLYVYALRLNLVSIGALFVAPFAFRFWLKFSLLWFALSFVVISSVTPHPGGGMLLLFDFTRMDVSKFMANAYVFLSVVLIILAYMERWRARQPY